jgi:hypothetical protein
VRAEHAPYMLEIVVTIIDRGGNLAAARLKMEVK